MENPAHRWEYLIGIIFTFVFSVAVVVLTFIFVAGTGENVFQRKVGYLLDSYETQATPADWTFILLYMILMYQLIWLVYGLSTLCRKSKGGYLYYCPLYMPMFVYFFYFCGMCLFLVYIFLWDSEIMLGALACAAAAMVAFLVAAWVSFVYLRRFEYDLERSGHKCEISHVHGMVQNGIAMMVSWCGVMCLMLLSSCLKEKHGMTPENAATLALSLLAGAILFLGIFNVYVLDKYLRFIFSPFIVFAVYLCGILARHCEYFWERNLIIALVLFIVVLILLLIKIILVMLRTMCCGRYCGCMPTLQCGSNGCCCEFNTVDDCSVPTKRPETPKRSTVVFSDSPRSSALSTTDDCKPRPILSNAMALPPPPTQECSPCSGTLALPAPPQPCGVTYAPHNCSNTCGCTKPKPVPCECRSETREVLNAGCGARKEVLNGGCQGHGGCRLSSPPLQQARSCVNALKVHAPPVRRCCHSHPTCRCGHRR